MRLHVKRLNFICALLLLYLAANAAERKALVLFVQWDDLRFSASKEQMQSFTDSLGIYFNDQFHSGTTFSFTRGPIITLDGSYVSSGSNSSTYIDDQMYKGVIEACKQAADSLDITVFDNGSATTIRDLLIMVPGQTEKDAGTANLFHPQFVEFKTRRISPMVEGRKLVCYGLACESGPDGEFGGIGDMAHEYSHILGLKDLYDVDGEGSGGLSKCLWGSICLMDRGNENGGGHTPPNWSAADLYTVGAGIGEVIDAPGSYNLEPIDVSGRYYIFKGPWEGEVFLAESRLDRGWDKYIGGHGLVIYHYDRSSGDALWSDYEAECLTAEQRWKRNRVNCNPEHECVHIEAPDSTSAFFPSGGNGSFSSETEPAFRFWDGTTSPLAITGITQHSNGTVSFNLIRPISGLRATPFQTSVVLNWKCDHDLPAIDSCVVYCVQDGDTLSRTRGVRDSGDDWLCTIGSLNPGQTYRMSVRIMSGGHPFFTGRINASTSSMRAGMFPYIYLRGVERGENGAFAAGTRIPLQVFNAKEAERLEWYFDDTRLGEEDGGIFTVTRPGTLRVEIYRKDGSIEHVIKEITVK